MPKQNNKDISKDKEDQKVRFLSLIVTSDCNLACKYCYEKHGLRDKKIMDFSLAKETITEEDKISMKMRLEAIWPIIENFQSGQS